jgi:hypothetical protein
VKDAYKIIVGRHEGKIPVGKHSRGWKDNTKIDVQETEYEVMDWIKPVHNKSSTASCCIHGNEPSGSVTRKECLHSINDYQPKKKQHTSQG